MWLLKNIEKMPDEEIQKLIDKVIKDADDKWGLDFEGEYPTNAVGISTLRPFHVETATLPNPTRINSWRLAIAAVQTWQDWVNVQLDENLFVLNVGMWNNSASPSLTEIGVQANGIQLPVQNIEQMYSFEEPKLYWSKPYSVAPENNFTLRAYGNVIQTDELGVIGFTIAKRLILIQET